MTTRSSWSTSLKCSPKMASTARSAKSASASVRPGTPLREGVLSLPSQWLSKRLFRLPPWCLTKVLTVTSPTCMAERFQPEHNQWDLNSTQLVCQPEVPATGLTKLRKALLLFQGPWSVLEVRTTRWHKADSNPNSLTLTIKLAKTLWTYTSRSQCKLLKSLPIQSSSCLKRNMPALWSKRTRSSTREKFQSLSDYKFPKKAIRVEATAAKWNNLMYQITSKSLCLNFLCPWSPKTIVMTGKNLLCIGTFASSKLSYWKRKEFPQTSDATPPSLKRVWAKCRR